MKYRRATLLAATDLDVAGTKTIEINVNQPISRIGMEWKITKSISYMNNYAHKDITKIELLDGSDILHSLDGGKNQALCIFDRRVPTMKYGQCIGASSQRTFYGIDFGRYLYDPMLALDPARFNNLQLKISHNQSTSDTGATVNSLEVWADIFDEKVISPIGFLMAKCPKEYTVGASDSYDYTKLPTDHPYRKMLIQGYYSAQEPWLTIKEARLSEDNDKRVPFDLLMEEYYRERQGIDQMVQEQLVTQIEVTERAYYVTPTDYWAGAIMQMSDTSQTSGVAYCGRGGYLLLNAAGGVEANGLVHGWLPNHCWQIPFGNEQDIDDWYDVSKIGSLELRLRAGAGSVGTGTGAVILQQLRRY